MTYTLEKINFADDAMNTQTLDRLADVYSHYNASITMEDATNIARVLLETKALLQSNDIDTHAVDDALTTLSTLRFRDNDIC